MDNGSKEYTFFWFIENYSYCWHKNREKLISPNFTADGLDGTVWRLELHPRGRRILDKGYISLSLNRTSSDSGPANILLKYGLSILAADGSNVASTEFLIGFRRGFRFGGSKLLRISEVFLKGNVDSFHQDVLAVRCKMWKGEGKVHKIAPICARTRIATDNISFLHIVDNFSSFDPNQKKNIEVRSHSKKVNNQVLSNLYYTYNSCSEGELIVEILSSNKNHILCKRKISLLDGSGNIIECGEDDNRFDSERKDIQKLPLSLTRHFILTNKSEYLPEDKLTLLCECAFSNGLEFETTEETQHGIAEASVKCNKITFKSPEKVRVKPFSLIGDMKSIYTNTYLADIVVKTKTKSFAAHKIILCIRSPVFNAMITNDMTGKYNDCIQIDDLKDDIVRQLLLFLYSDIIENLQWNAATQLYCAAYNYQIGLLRKICASFLEENLTTTNAGELLVLLDAHHDNNLKKKVEDFILEHENQVFASDEWETLMETNPLLLLKTMHLKYKRKKNEIR